jgi:DNA repair exonuclease SbcCD ATPase subunit
MPDMNWINLAFNIATFIVLGGGAVYAARVKGRVQAQQDLIDLLNQEVNAVRGRANRLHDELDESLKANRELQTNVSKLESLPDMTRLLDEMTAQREWGEKRTIESMKSVAQMFENHETRAMERHKLMIESFGRLNEGLAAINESLRRINGWTQ